MATMKELARRVLDAEQVAEQQRNRAFQGRNNSGTPCSAFLDRVSRAAGEWELGIILTDAEMEFARGKLPGGEVERIAAACAAQAIRLAKLEPEPGACSQASDPTPGPGDVLRCPVCGQTKWWTDCFGNRKCGVCHPRPGGKP